MLRNYLKIAFKVLMRRKVFTLMSLFGIVFTLTALISAATIIDHVFGAHRPEVKSDRTLGLYSVTMTGMNVSYGGECGYALIEHCTRNLPDLEEMTVFTGFERETAFSQDRVTELWTKYTDASFWHVLQFDFLEGRPYSSEEVESGQFVVVINDATRRSFFGHNSALGQTLNLDGRNFTVIGVVHNVPMLRHAPFADVWIPQTAAKSDAYKREIVGDHLALLVARDGSKLPGIRAAIAARAKSVDLSDYPAYEAIDIRAETYFENFARMVSDSDTQSSEAPTTRLAGGAMLVALLFMLLPAVNLTNLATSRILERGTEIGVRKAFGASSLALIGQFIIENLLLTMIGCVMALGTSALLLSWLSSTGWLPHAEFHYNARIAAMSFGFAIVFALLSGFYPAWRMSRLQPDEVLRRRLG